MNRRKQMDKDEKSYPINEHGKTNFEILYENLFHKLYPKLLFYATQFLDESEAEDIVQDVFLELWKRRESLEWGDQLPSYLYRLVYNKSINQITHNKVKGKYMEAQEELLKHKMEFYETSNDHIVNKIENEEIENQLNRVIDSLPTQCRQVFKMSYLQEMKNKEIADVLEISLRTVEAHMYKALKTLRKKLKDI